VQLEGARVLLTGATGGIGLAIAERLAAHGASLLLTARGEDSLQRAAATLAARGATVEVVAADLGTAAGIERVALAAERFGADVLVNNAGTNVFGMLEQLGSPDVGQILRTNLEGPVQLVHRLLPQLLSRRRAMIVNVGSSFGSIGFAGFAVYCASKFGLRGFTEALRRELADGPVRACYVAPRAVETSFNPPEVVRMNADLGNRADPPEAVAAAVERAIIGERRETYLGQPEGFFARLNGLLPGVVDGALRKKLAIIKRHAAA
jgi:short-subunit dehydrogenase